MRSRPACRRSPCHCHTALRRAPPPCASGPRRIECELLSNLPPQRKNAPRVKYHRFGSRRRGSRSPLRGRDAPPRPERQQKEEVIRHVRGAPSCFPPCRADAARASLGASARCRPCAGKRGGARRVRGIGAIDNTDRRIVSAGAPIRRPGRDAGAAAHRDRVGERAGERTGKRADRRGRGAAARIGSKQHFTGDRS